MNLWQLSYAKFQWRCFQFPSALIFIFVPTQKKINFTNYKHSHRFSEWWITVYKSWLPMATNGPPHRSSIDLYICVCGKSLDWRRLSLFRRTRWLIVSAIPMEEDNKSAQCILAVMSNLMQEFFLAVFLSHPTAQVDWRPIKAKSDTIGFKSIVVWGNQT